MPIGSPQWMYASGEAFTLDQSLKFDNAADAYLSKTPTSAGNRRTWTFSAWLKIGTPNTWTSIFSAGANGSNMTRIRIDDNGGRIFFDSEVSGSTQQRFYTSAFYRDTSAWYHFVLAVDTTQGTASNRVKMYVNGSQVTAFAQSDYPSQNYDYHINNTQVHYVGRQVGDTNGDWNGYMAEVHFIDGTALTPTSFGEFGDYGEWKPIEVSGLTYGTNGFYLSFAGGGIMTATGGTITTDGDYKVHSFTADGTFTPTSIPDAGGYVEYLVIAGGGAGGRALGGGGAGGYRTGMLSITTQAYSITVGDGGAATTGSGTGDNGDNSVFSTITSIGGGGGGRVYTNSGHGASGGSGGGGSSADGGSANGGSGTAGQGYAGGSASNSSGTQWNGGGGGGAGAAAANSTTISVATAGGGGLTSSITGSSVTRAGGGGGGAYLMDSAGTNGAGGSGGGGAGGKNGVNPIAGTANTGSGGGGNGVTNAGHVQGSSSAAGGSGIVIIRYKFQ